MFDITALGEILIDFTPTDKKDTFCKNPGGAPANLLATASKYGSKCAFIGKVGNDMFGSFLISVLKENGIDYSGVTTDPIHNTTLAFVDIDTNGDRDFSFYRNFGADVFLSKKEVPVNIIKNSKIFHFGTLSLTNKISKEATDYAIKIAKKNGLIISFDPNYRELLWDSKNKAAAVMKHYVKCADIVKVSKEEAFMITGKTDKELAAKEIYKMGAGVVLLTDGANGIIYYGSTFGGYVPSIKADTIDTTGAGDIFFGTFIHEMLSLNKIPATLTADEAKMCVIKAAKASGLSTEKSGAIPSIPDYNRIEAVKL